MEHVTPFPTFRVWTIAPRSKKNRSRIVFDSKNKCPACGRGRPFVLASEEAVNDEAQIQRDCADELVKLPRWQKSLDGVMFPDEDVRVTVIVNMRTKHMDVEVEPMGPRPKGFSGRSRDLHSHIDVLMDALQGSVIKNDNQVAEVFVMRTLGPDSTPQADTEDTQLFPQSVNGESEA